MKSQWALSQGRLKPRVYTTHKEPTTVCTWSMSLPWPHYLKKFLIGKKEHYKSLQYFILTGHSNKVTFSGLKSFFCRAPAIWWLLLYFISHTHTPKTHQGIVLVGCVCTSSPWSHQSVFFSTSTCLTSVFPSIYLLNMDLPECGCVSNVKN